jgi:SSS family solute:Na+ symporter
LLDPTPIELLQKTNFTAFDWGIVVLYLVASLAIGLLARRYVRSMASYIGAGRQVGTWLGVATMTGTELGLVTVYGAKDVKSMLEGLEEEEVGE